MTSVSDRDSFVSARIDYLNRMFHNRAYEVAAADNPRLAHLDVLLPRVMLTVRPAAGVAARALRQAVLGVLPVAPLQVRELAAERGRLGSDMYIFMARENLRIYLIGGVLMALIGIVAVALSNYAQDRRTLGLLRIRGCGPRQIWHFLTANLLAPSLAGLVFGFGVAQGRDRERTARTDSPGPGVEDRRFRSGGGRGSGSCAARVLQRGG